MKRARTHSARIAFYLTLSFSLLACITIDRVNNEDENQKYALALERLDSATGDLSDIQNFVERVISRRKIILRVPRTEIPSSIADGDYNTLPSTLFDILNSKNPPPNLAAAITSFLYDASNKTIIKGVYSSGCGINFQTALPADTKFNQKRVSRQLDAVATIQFHQCEGDISKPLKIPKDVLSTDTKSIRSLMEKRQDAALNEPFQIAPDKTQNLIAGQAFRFSSTLDKDIAVARTVSNLIQDQANELINLYKPIAMNEFKGFVLDRDKIPEASESIKESEKGWFNALGVDGVVYLSPTFALSAVISCTKEVQYVSSFRARLMTEARPQLLDRRLTYSDVQGATSIAENMSKRTKKCIGNQLTFLLAHELGHAITKANEGKSDCLAVSALKLLGRSDLGVFGTIIFGFLGTENESILGLDKHALELLTNRKNQINEFRHFDGVSMLEALEECKKHEYLS